MKQTIYTIAKEAGVSIATVSRAFNNHPRISPETKEKIFQIAEAMGYQPSASARSLATSETQTIALVLPQISGPFYSELIRGAESITKEQQYHLLIYTSQDLDERDPFLSLLPTRVDGMVLGAYFSTGQYLQMLARQGIPHIILGEPDHGLEITTINPENQEGAYRLTKHLIEEHDLRDIAFIRGPENRSHSLDRLLGYQKALREHGITPHEEWVVLGDFTESSGYDCARQLLQQNNPPKAIFASNDLMAIGAMAAASQHGLSVPGDLAIVGFDDVPSARYLQPPLTTVSVETFEQGRQAIEQLLVRIADPRIPHQQLTFPAPVVVRRSCGCIPRE